MQSAKATKHPISGISWSSDWLEGNPQSLNLLDISGHPWDSALYWSVGVFSSSRLQVKPTHLRYSSQFWFRQIFLRGTHADCDGSTNVLKLIKGSQSRVPQSRAPVVAIKSEKRNTNEKGGERKRNHPSIKAAGTMEQLRRARVRVERL